MVKKMKIVFDKLKLLNVLVPAMSCVSAKSTFTSAEGILIETKGEDRCTICTYDMEKGVKATVSCGVLEEGAYIVNAADFFQYIRVMPGNDITLSVNEKLVATVSCGKIYYLMHALQGRDFPTIPDLEGDGSFVMEQRVFKSVIKHTIHSVSAQDSNHPELCGGFFRITEGGITMVSCDSFTLAKCDYKCEIDISSTDGYQFIIPGKSLFELVKMLSDGEEEFLTIKPERKHIIFIIGDIVFFTRIIDLKYIDYNRIIQTNLPIEVVINSAVFLDSLERISLISEKKSTGSTKSHLKMKLEGNVMKLSSVAVTGQVYDEIECAHTGEDIEIGFTCRYLIDALRAADCDYVRLYLKGPRISMIMRPDDPEAEKDLLYMILPVRLND